MRFSEAERDEINNIDWAEEARLDAKAARRRAKHNLTDCSLIVDDNPWGPALVPSDDPSLPF